MWNFLAHADNPSASNRRAAFVSSYHKVDRKPLAISIEQALDGFVPARGCEQLAFQVPGVDLRESQCRREDPSFVITPGMAAIETVHAEFVNVYNRPAATR
jgi:hypothetical protein